MSRSVEVTLHASGAETVSGNSGDLGFPPKEAVLFLDVTASAGTAPTLDITIEEKDPLSGKYSVIDTFAQKVAVGVERRTLTVPFGNQVRAVWTIGGSAGQTFTFSLSMRGKVE